MVDMDKTRRYLALRLILCMTALLFLMFVFSGVSAAFYSDKNNNSNRVEISLRAENVDNEKLIRQKDVTEVKQRLKKSVLSYVRELDSFVQDNNRTYPVKACLTDNAFTQFSDVYIVKGCFFNEATSEEGLNAAVISQALAEKLYGTYNVIGRRFELFNEKYKIIGLYRNKESAISFFSSDGMERIYIPYRSYAAFKDLPFKTVFLRYEGLETKGFRKNYIRELFKIDDQVYKINDFYEKSDVFTGLSGLFVFIIGLWSIFIAGRGLVNHCRSGYGHIKESMGKMYLKGMLTEEKWFLMRMLLVILGSVAVMTIIFFVTRCKINIPAEYIPFDNVFDFKFYFEKLKMSVNSANLSAGYIPTHLEASYNNALKVKLIVLLLSLVSFLSMLPYIKLLKRLRYTGRTVVKIYVVPAAAALLLALPLSFFSGVEFCLPLKAIAAVYIFLSLKLVGLPRFGKGGGSKEDI